MVKKIEKEQYERDNYRDAKLREQREREDERKKQIRAEMDHLRSKERKLQEEIEVLRQLRQMPIKVPGASAANSQAASVNASMMAGGKQES